jgi:hypothetical protein
MTEPKIEMEVPLQVREFAKKSVDQAEKAISSFMDSASKSVDLVPGPMTDIAKQTLAITEKNLKASFVQFPRRAYLPSKYPRIDSRLRSLEAYT